MPSTAAATAGILADAGIRRVFGLPGGEVLVLMDELRRTGVDFVLMRHEANAGLAAAVYGKLKRQPGVVLTTLGPGAANLMLPISNAYLDLEPLLAISAQIPDEFPSSHTHQLLPLHDVYRPIARYVEQITGANVFDVVPRALASCMERPFGVSYLTLSAREALKPASQRAAEGVGGVFHRFGLRGARGENTSTESVENTPDPLTGSAKAADGFFDRGKEALLAESREDTEPPELVLDGIFHLGETHLDARSPKRVVELHDGVGGRHVDAGDRFCRDDEAADWRR
jgi:thiamine pyrophosphate-dependent enzyme